MKKRLLFSIFLIIILFVAGCSSINPKVKECTRLCFENGGSISQALKDSCQSSCSQLLYYGGEAEIDKHIESLKTEGQVNEVVYGTKQVQNTEVIAPKTIDGCKELDQNAKNICVMKFVNEDNNFDDSSVCSWITDKKSDCLSILTLRKSIKTKNPLLCKPTSNFKGCYAEYLKGDTSCKKSKSSEGMDICALNLLKISKSDFPIDSIKQLREEMKEGNQYYYFGDLSLSEAIFKNDFDLCDDLCKKDPEGFNRNSEDCDRTKCLSLVVLFNQDKDYNECNSYYLKDPHFGEKEGIVNCLMAQAKRDNNQELCDELETTSPPFIDICKKNVADWNS